MGLINRMWISEGLDKVGSKSHIKEAEDRTPNHIGSNVLVEGNAEQRSKGGRRNGILTEKGLQYPGANLGWFWHRYNNFAHIYFGWSN